ncbi:MAG: DUF4248 domain-containing protein [Bacteroidaceae bacterium]|nr:DUF4248 domain-containing protein [Bacteroidaceae bacterium]
MSIASPNKKGKARKCLLSKQKTQFGTLAMRYYPGRGYKRAVHLFRQELEHTRGLLEALQDVDYRPQQRTLNKRQLEVIQAFLGEP